MMTKQFYIILIALFSLLPTVGRAYNLTPNGGFTGQSHVLLEINAGHILAVYDRNGDLKSRTWHEGVDFDEPNSHWSSEVNLLAEGELSSCGFLALSQGGVAFCLKDNTSEYLTVYKSSSDFSVIPIGHHISNIYDGGDQIVIKSLSTNDNCALNTGEANDDCNFNVDTYLNTWSDTAGLSNTILVNSSATQLAWPVFVSDNDIVGTMHMVSQNSLVTQVWDTAHSFETDGIQTYGADANGYDYDHWTYSAVTTTAGGIFFTLKLERQADNGESGSKPGNLRFITWTRQQGWGDLWEKNDFDIFKTFVDDNDVVHYLLRSNTIFGWDRTDAGGDIYQSYTWSAVDGWNREWQVNYGNNYYTGATNPDQTTEVNAYHFATWNNNNLLRFYYWNQIDGWKKLAANTTTSCTGNCINLYTSKKHKMFVLGNDNGQLSANVWLPDTNSWESTQILSANAHTTVSETHGLVTEGGQFLSAWPETQPDGSGIYKFDRWEKSGWKKIKTLTTKSVSGEIISSNNNLWIRTFAGDNGYVSRTSIHGPAKQTHLTKHLDSYLDYLSLPGKMFISYKSTSGNLIVTSVKGN